MLTLSRIGIDVRFLLDGYAETKVILDEISHSYEFNVEPRIQVFYVFVMVFGNILDPTSPRAVIFNIVYKALWVYGFVFIYFFFVSLDQATDTFNVNTLPCYFPVIEYFFCGELIFDPQKCGNVNFDIVRCEYILYIETFL